ncbi:MAG: hypothetical protein ABMA26_11395, partial [Limisphaerales bacterium]
MARGGGISSRFSTRAKGFGCSRCQAFVTKNPTTSAAAAAIPSVRQCRHGRKMTLPSPGASALLFSLAPIGGEGRGEG